jgi:hypothetical protein
MKPGEEDLTLALKISEGTPVAGFLVPSIMFKRMAELF